MLSDEFAEVATDNRYISRRRKKEVWLSISVQEGFFILDLQIVERYVGCYNSYLVKVRPVTVTGERPGAVVVVC